MALSFPSSPSSGQTYTVGNKTWVYNGYAWDLISSNGQAIYNTANAAFAAANTAVAGSSAAAYAQANNAYTQANNAWGTANAAFAKANTGGIDKTPIGVEEPFKNSKDLMM